MNGQRIAYDKRAKKTVGGYTTVFFIEYIGSTFTLYIGFMNMGET